MNYFCRFHRISFLLTPRFIPLLRLRPRRPLLHLLRLRGLLDQKVPPQPLLLLLLVDLTLLFEACRVRALRQDEVNWPSAWILSDCCVACASVNPHHKYVLSICQSVGTHP